MHATSLLQKPHENNTRMGAVTSAAPKEEKILFVCAVVQSMNSALACCIKVVAYLLQQAVDDAVL